MNLWCLESVVITQVKTYVIVVSYNNKATYVSTGPVVSHKIFYYLTLNYLQSALRLIQIDSNQFLNMLKFSQKVPYIYVYNLSMFVSFRYSFEISAFLHRYSIKRTIFPGKINVRSVKN